MPYIRRILCIDDDPDALRVLTEYLALEGYEVMAAPDGASGIQMLTQESVQLIITDLNMPGLTGMDVIEIVHKNYPHLQIIVVTGFGTIETVLEALHKGAIDYLVKPYLLEILKLSLGKAERQAEIEDRLRRAEEAGSLPGNRHLLEALPLPTALLGAGRQVLQQNERFAALFGDWGPDGPQLLPAKARRRLEDFLHATGTQEDSLLLRLGGKGGERVLELSLLPVEGNREAFLLQANEVDLPQAAEADGLEEALLVISPGGSLLWGNGAAVDWFGLDEDSFPTVTDLLGEALDPAQLAPLADDLPATAAFSWNVRLPRGRGPQQVQILATPLLDERLRRLGSVLSLRAAGPFQGSAPFDRGNQGEESLPLLKVGEQGRVRWISKGLARLSRLPVEELLQRPHEELLAELQAPGGASARQFEEHARVAQSDGLLVELRPRDPVPIALDIEEQKAKLYRASNFLHHLLSEAGAVDHARLRERLDEVAHTLVQSGLSRRAAVYLRNGETLLGWGFAGYAPEEEEAIRRDPGWRATCEDEERIPRRVGAACLCPAEGRDGPEAWLVLPIQDRHQREVGRLRLEGLPSDSLPGEAQIHLIELMLRHVALALDELELERQVARSEARYHDLYENAKYSIIVVDVENGRILDVNREAELLTGFARSELIGKRVWETRVEDYQEAARRNWLKTLQRESTSFENVPLKRKDGSTIYVEYHCLFSEFNGRPVVQSFYHDVTEKQALEYTLIQSQKLAGLGQLSAGVAHELRNPLGIMGSSLYYINSVLDKEEKVPDQVRKHLGIIKNEVDRSCKIIENLLSFSRVSSQERERVDLNDLLHVTLDLVKKELLVNNIRLVTEFGELPSVQLNLDELKQGFLNIILNATQAMPDGGLLRIRSRLEATRVLIEFEDTGQGISKDNLLNVLNPFFTTKEPGMGTGLGLSLTHSFIRRAGGDLTVESELGIGTTVRIWLPACEQQELS